MRPFLALLVLTSAPLLGGCVAGIAANAVGMAVSAADGGRESNAHLVQQAVADCSARAAEHGEVHIIDVEQRSAGKLTVWGTADDGTERRSFECGFTTKVTGFKLRQIRT